MKAHLAVQPVENRGGGLYLWIGDGDKDNLTVWFSDVKKETTGICLRSCNPERIGRLDDNLVPFTDTKSWRKLTGEVVLEF